MEYFHVDFINKLVYLVFEVGLPNIISHKHLKRMTF